MNDLATKLSKLFRGLCCCVLTISMCSPVYGDTIHVPLSKLNTFEEIVISGTVTDDNGQPLPGASVLVKESSTEVSTGFDGNYTINIPSNKKTVLVFSYLGFITPEVALEDQTVVHITLSEDAVGLNEVVVVGYGTQKKSHLIKATAKMVVKIYQKSRYRCR